MSARYRLIHFLPDPFSGWRVPIGALVEQSTHVRAVAAAGLPGPRCVGGESTHALLTMLVDALPRVHSFEALPASFGPHAAVTEPMPVPQSADDPLRWVVEHVLPRPLASAVPEREYGPRREVVGRRFFQQHRVDKWVERRLTPARFGLSERTALPVTHYVAGGSDLLLLEPVIVTRQRFEDDLTDISSTFLAWKQLLAESGRSVRPQFIAYVFAFGLVDRAQEAREVLEGQSHVEVMDVDVPAQKAKLLASVRDVGAGGELVH